MGRVGFGWACRTIAFVTVPGNLYAVVVLRLPEQAVRKEGRALVDWSMAKEHVFRMLCASAFVVFVGLYIPVFFVQEYAAVKTDLGREVVRYLVPVLMTGQTVGRVLPNVVAERIGTLNVSVGITVGCAVLAFAWVAVASSVGVMVWAVLYGFVSGGYVSLLPPLVVGFGSEHVETRDSDGNGDRVWEFWCVAWCPCWWCPAGRYWQLCRIAVLDGCIVS